MDLKQSDKKFFYDLLRHSATRLNTGLFISTAKYLMDAGQPTDPIWAEAIRADLPDGEINDFFNRLSAVLGGEPVKDVSDVWRAHNLPRNVKKRLLRGAGAVL